MKRIFILINLLMITGVVYFAVDVFYGFIEAQMDVSPLPRMTEIKAVSIESEQHKPYNHYRSIEDRNLFQTTTEAQISAQKAIKDAEPIEEPLKKTDLKLKLRGAITGDKAHARAIIEDPKTRKQILLKEGESIEHAKIKQILWNEVILSVNGVDEVLEMEKPGIAGRPSGPPTPSIDPRRASVNKGSRGVRSQSISISRSEIDQATSNINTIMKQARFRPHYFNGKPNGLTVTRIKPNSIFTKLGLQSGDIILGIDGENIQTVDDALKFYTGLKSSSNVELKIKRRGLERTLDYNIE